MAKAGAKTRVVANAKRLKILKMIILAANVGLPLYTNTFFFASYISLLVRGQG